MHLPGDHGSGLLQEFALVLVFVLVVVVSVVLVLVLVSAPPGPEIAHLPGQSSYAILLSFLTLLLPCATFLQEF